MLEKEKSNQIIQDLETDIEHAKNEVTELKERNHELQMQLHKSSTDVIYLKEAIRILVK